MALLTALDSRLSAGGEIRLPANAERDASGNDWECKPGYRRVNNECEAESGISNWYPVLPLYSKSAASGQPAGSQATGTANGGLKLGATAAGGAVAASNSSSTSTSTATATATANQ
jgi:hypothetical protein